MPGSQGTLIQRWGVRTLAFLSSLLVLLHLSAGLLAALYCPEMLKAKSYPGDHCQPRGGNSTYLEPECLNTPGMRQTVGEGICLTRGEGDLVKLSDLRLSFRFPGERDGEAELYSPWNWRLVASLAVNLHVLAEDLPGLISGELTEEVMLSASLDYAPLKLLEASSASGVDCLPSSPWHSLAIVLRLNRTLHCNLAPPRDFTRAGHKAELSFHCSIHPIFELSVVSNSSYMMQVQLEKPLASSSSFSSLLSSNATVSSQLTVVKETQEYHHLVFYTKCFFTPILLACLVWFVVRLCINDLYVTIHDRLLITAGLAQVLVNVPSETLVAAFPDPFLRLIDPLAHIILVASLALFWTIFTLDKLADNEPWERTTRYYWRPLFSLILASLVCLLGLLYLRLPSLSNPFTSHWVAGPTTLASLGFTFGLAITAAAFQTYLAVIIFRVLCDISVHYPGSSRGLWRLKLILAYCLLLSLLICLGSFLHLAVSLALHWNSSVHTQPLPFSVTVAGALYLTELAGTNLHLSALLISLSRSPGDGRGGDWYTPVRPVMYSPAREEQLHLWDLSAQTSPLHK